MTIHRKSMILILMNIIECFCIYIRQFKNVPNKYLNLFAGIKIVEHLWKNIGKFSLAPMGVLPPGFVYATPSAQPPIDTSGNIPAHVSAESPSNISPNPSEVISEVSEPYDNF